MRIRFLFLLLFITLVCHAQQATVVDFEKLQAVLYIDPYQKTVEGSVAVQFKVLKDTSMVYLDARNMELLGELKSDKVLVSSAKNKIEFKGDFKANKIYKISFSYKAFPKKTMYFFGWDTESAIKQVWTQGQGKYTSHWLPSLDYMNDKIEFDLTIRFDKNYQVITNGKLVESNTNNGKTQWQYDMQQPMSSYLVAVAIGNYESQKLISNSGIPLVNYYHPSDANKVEPTYRYTQQIFDFLEAEIGVPFPWQNYKQIPVRDFLYAGMENTGATIFANSFMVDSIGFSDNNYVNVNAHELAHQWFGNLVTEVSGTDHWLHEGFATYYALLAEREVFGAAYYSQRLYESAEQLNELSQQGKGESLLNPKASSLTFYQKGAWALHMLREEVGDEAFELAIKNYLKKYQFKNVTTNDFMAEVELTSGKDLVEFVELWLQSKHFPYEEAMASLIAQPDFFIDRLFEVTQNEFQHPSKKKSNERYEFFKKVLDAAVYYPVKTEVIDQIKDDVVPFRVALLKQALATDDLKLRQYIIGAVNEIPQELQAEFESLLDDESYITQENALFRLWANFPDMRMTYLDKTKGVEGLRNKNIRTLWLALALVTSDYNEENKASWYQELSSYTSPKYSFEIRENAFRYLIELAAYNDQNLLDLINAATHPNWRFASFAKKTLQSLLEDTTWQERFKKLAAKLSSSEQSVLKQLQTK
ncbi:M1 family metallopeptidase [Spongiivirga citrea]|uniref:Aminopeptidase N n=1 Tax=Spongiivirga citrea TaxID=1481457 RepID=A0A6M0CQY0_9FLAO|nr:M1 family aminopeptidase [Spongiivirga citrea]NER16340.1 M1 family peptidase [Spongiivirga citrea]